MVGKFTYFGDANLDGMVTADDYLNIDANLLQEVGDQYAMGEINWFRGDFNGDGMVTADHYLYIDSHLLMGTGNPLSATGMAALGNAAVPEPSMLGVLLGGAVSMSARRRRRPLLAGATQL